MGLLADQQILRFVKQIARSLFGSRLKLRRTPVLLRRLDVFARIQIFLGTRDQLMFRLERRIVLQRSQRRFLTR